LADILVGIGEVVYSRRPGDTLLTMALGSCVALVALDPRTGGAGVAHVALPGGGRPDGRSRSVGYYADSAVPALLGAMARIGSAPSGQGLVFKLTGGATILTPMRRLHIGARNVLAVRTELAQRGLTLWADDTGGDHSRTVRIAVGTATVHIRSPGRPACAL
jgi:chemotaxis protein CheD